MTAVTQPRVVRSEWTKLHSLRSSRITLLVAVGLVIGLGLLIALVSVGNWDAVDEANRPVYNSVERSLSGIYFAQLAFGVLGVLLVAVLQVVAPEILQVGDVDAKRRKHAVDDTFQPNPVHVE